jgi:hypothetical protein
MTDNEPPKLVGIPGGDPEPSNRPIGLWLELILAIVLAGVLGLLGVGFLINALGARSHGRGGQLVGAIVCFGLAFLCTRWAIAIEHRMRRHQPTAQAFAAAQANQSKSTKPTSVHVAQAGGTRPRRAPGRAGVAGRGKYGPLALGISIAVFGLGAVALAVGAVYSYKAGQRSTFVQHHGIRANGLVEEVDNTQHCSKSGCDYTAAILVNLSPPVDGAQTTTVHYPDFSNLENGETITVLVDPKQLDYAELPGSRFESSWLWIVLVVLAIVCAVLTGLDALALRHLLAHRRAQRAGPTPTTLTAT